MDTQYLSCIDKLSCLTTTNGLYNHNIRVFRPHADSPHDQSHGKSKSYPLSKFQKDGSSRKSLCFYGFYVP